MSTVNIDNDKRLKLLSVLFPRSYKTLLPVLPVQRDTGRDLHAEGGPGWHTVLLQGPLQCVCARGV